VEEKILWCGVLLFISFTYTLLAAIGQASLTINLPDVVFLFQAASALEQITYNQA